MNRKQFFNKSLQTALGMSFVGLVSFQNDQAAAEDDTVVGYNHLPKEERKKMNTIFHAAGTRGFFDHGWLKTWHSFSFASYMNRERMNFGVLRVLNDDEIAPGMGFGEHPHDNMEIITIPLEGDLAHKDSMGNSSVIKEGDVQVMSAGKGIRHSEFNANGDKAVKLLQIWLYPKLRNVEPRYDQISIRDIDTKNKWGQILSPTESDQGVWIHQDAWFYLADFDKKASYSYTLKRKGNGVYLFLISGKAQVNGSELNRRDAIGIWDVDEITIDIKENSKILLMDIPMKIDY